MALESLYLEGLLVLKELVEGAALAIGAASAYLASRLSQGFLKLQLLLHLLLLQVASFGVVKETRYNAGLAHCREVLRRHFLQLFLERTHHYDGTYNLCVASKAKGIPEHLHGLSRCPPMFFSHLVH